MSNTVATSHMWLLVFQFVAILKIWKLIKHSFFTRILRSLCFKFVGRYYLQKAFCQILQFTPLCQHLSTSLEAPKHLKIGMWLFGCPTSHKCGQRVNPIGHRCSKCSNFPIRQMSINMYVQQKPLNVITLGQAKSDNINQVITITGGFIR